MDSSNTGTLLGLSQEEEARLLPHRPILVGYRGSIAHGLYSSPAEPTGIDDKDIHCVYVLPIEHYFGLTGLREVRGRDIKVREWDCAAYELRKFAFLLSECNPNVLSLLWLQPAHQILVEPGGKRLIESRDLFSSRRAYHTFCGYAHAQLKRMTAYRDSGGDGCCDGEEFHDKDCALARERGRGSAKKFATGFMGAKRKRLVKEFGYDAANAAHCIRLLRMGSEFLRTGVLRADRSEKDVNDADELLAIKRGEWSIESVIAEAERLFSGLKDARDGSPLPEQPDRKAIDALLVGILSRSLRHKRGRLAISLSMDDQLSPTLEKAADSLSVFDRKVRVMGVRDIVRIVKLARRGLKFKNILKEELMKPGFKGKKTLGKGARGLVYGAGAAAGTAALSALIAFFGDSAAITTILSEAGVSPVVVGSFVALLTGLVKMADNVWKQRK